MDNELEERLLTSGTEQEGDLKVRVCEESKKIWRVALPGVIARVSSFGTVVVTQSFLGHISAVDLAGYALIQSLGVRFVNGVLIGMSSATETLCGQAFGAKQYHMMGVFLQRSWLVDLATLTILLPLFFLGTSIFKLLGAMAALNISAWLVVFGEFIYVFGGWCPDSWKGFSLAALKDIPPVVKLSIASGLMICLELWYYAVLVLIAGYMKNAEVAISAFSVCLNINGWEFMICLGILGAACVRVANELGRGDAKAVKFTIKVLLSTSVLIGLLFWILCLVFGNKIGYLFSNDEAVAKSVADLSPLLAFSMLFNSIYPVFSGVAVGAGLQATVAIVNVVCFYLIGLPIGLVLGYVAHLQVKGIWIGMLCGVITETLVLSFLMWRTNWDEEVLKASRRLKRWYLQSPEEAGQKSDQA
ncbi:protein DETOXIFICATION 24 [Sesamum alatum]|uniref:Protein DETOXIFICATION 24 n=1 Tax=Sesamum alatum TaxID=300844 RepID=A0AAE1XJS8_9LAMI|nr:protein DETOXIFICATION 24 [Sesamum alatum]